jgi:hypothetical protein
MKDDSANISIDFLVGVTIFMICFIWVATMIPGMMIGLQANTVDYDAVAYRTGVILVEDPGLPASWEMKTDYQIDEISRFGFAVSKNTPNVLSQAKVDRFFCKTFVYPDDYQERAIFGDYPYHFNISFRDIERNQTKSIGEIIPDGYGLIRRVTKIKGYSNATITELYMKTHRYNHTELVSYHQFSILVNNSKLLDEVTNPLYQIDPSKEPIAINITDLRSTLPTTYQPTAVIHLENISIYLEYTKVTTGETALSLWGPFENPCADGICWEDKNVTYRNVPPIKKNVSVVMLPDYFASINAGKSRVFINLTFKLEDPPGTLLKATFLNNTWSEPFDYNYYPQNVTQPQLRDAVVEVAVW